MAEHTPLFINEHGLMFVHSVEKSLKDKRFREYVRRAVNSHAKLVEALQKIAVDAEFGADSFVEARQNLRAIEMTARAALEAAGESITAK